MNRKTEFLTVLALLACASAVVAGVQPLTLKFKTISAPGAKDTGLGGINNSNVVSGSYIDSSGVLHGMTLAGNQLVTIDDPNGTNTSPSGLNNTGMVVGNYSRGGNAVGFLYQNGTFTDVLPFASSSSFVGNVNDAGVMVGGYTDPNTGAQLAFYGPLGSYTSFQVPNSTAMQAAGINNAGLIVAAWEDSAGNWESSLYNPKTNTFTTINVPGALDSFANGINNHNEVVYLWLDASESFHGAVMSNGRFLKFDDPNGSAPGTVANGINDNGVVVGTFFPTGSMTYQGFAAFR
jgi:hypothetical protein